MRLFISFIVLLISCLPVYAQVQLKQVPAEPGRYIVTFKTQHENLRLAGKSPVERKQTMVNLRGSLSLFIENLKTDLAYTDLKVVRELWLRQAAAIYLSPEYLTRLRNLPYVNEVNPEKSYQLLPQGTLPLSGEDVGGDIEHIDIDELWSQGFRGQGVVVAILDTGVDYLHLDLKDNWRGGSNSWFDPYEKYEEPVDTLRGGQSHGTGVASIVLGGNLNESNNYLGVAPEATWIAARILDGDTSTESAISSALEWVLDPDSDPATDDYPDIVQNSWGITGTEGACDNPFSVELAAIDSAGIDIVFSVGNTTQSPPSTYLTPSFDKHVISVGAIDSGTDEIWVNSGRGPDKCNTPLMQIPSLVAPGVKIAMADITLGGLISNLDNITVSSGTSFSSPMVSGALALLRSKYSATDHLYYRQALYDSALGLGASSPNNDYGRGLLQASAASALLKVEADKPTSAVRYQVQEVNFTEAKYNFVENTSGTVDVTVIRSGDISNSVSVQVLSLNGTAVSGADFEPVNTAVTFLANESRKKVTVTLIDDTEAEGDESFSLVFSVPNTINFGNKSSISIVISDDDQAVEEEIIGGTAFGFLEIFFLMALAASRIVARWV